MVEAAERVLGGGRAAILHNVHVVTQREVVAKVLAIGIQVHPGAGRDAILIDGHIETKSISRGMRRRRNPQLAIIIIESHRRIVSIIRVSGKKLCPVRRRIGVEVVREQHRLGRQVIIDDRCDGVGRQRVVRPHEVTRPGDHFGNDRLPAFNQPIVDRMHVEGHRHDSGIDGHVRDRGVIRIGRRSAGVINIHRIAGGIGVTAALEAVAD